MAAVVPVAADVVDAQVLDLCAASSLGDSVLHSEHSRHSPQWEEELDCVG